MLIRSQDKEILIDFGNTSAIEITGASVVTTRNNVGWCCILGRYSNNEKCLKVLDMIQEAYAEYKITYTFLTGFTGHRAIVESNDICVNGFKELTENFKKNMVFQMPEDSEVEV